MMTKGFLTNLINNSIPQYKDEIRHYLGASSIGHACARSIWYKYNQYPSEHITLRQARTFAIGKKLEGLVIDCLKDAGLNIATEWYDLKDKDVPEFQGHVDGVLLNDSGNPIAIIEIKTARDSSFNIFVRRGLKYWYPIYYAQIQAYMGMSGIHEAYVIALNKDTSDIHDEKVFFNPSFYEDLKSKATYIIDRGDEPPPRINQSPMYFLCQGCSYKGVCHS